MRHALRLDPIDDAGGVLVAVEQRGDGSSCHGGLLSALLGEVLHQALGFRLGSDPPPLTRR
ncbi:hypothetical protein ACFQWF_23515 [Methylorubrum suomiense]